VAVPYPEVVWIRDDSDQLARKRAHVGNDVSYTAQTATQQAPTRSWLRVPQGDGRLPGYRFQRLVTNISPVANATANFALTPGVLRSRRRDDPCDTCQAHNEGYRIYKVADAGSSGGAYLSLSHNEDDLNSRLYFPAAGIYSLVSRYRNGSSGSSRFDSTCHGRDSGLLVPVGLATNTITVNSAGWHNLLVYHHRNDQRGPQYGLRLHGRLAP